MPPEVSPKSFGSFEKGAPGLLSKWPAWGDIPKRRIVDEATRKTATNHKVKFAEC